MKEGYPEQWLGGMSKGEGVAAEIRLLIVSGEIEVDTLLTENQIITDGSTYSIRTHRC